MVTYLNFLILFGHINFFDDAAGFHHKVCNVHLLPVSIESTLLQMLWRCQWTLKWNEEVSNIFHTTCRVSWTGRIISSNHSSTTFLVFILLSQDSTGNSTHRLYSNTVQETPGVSSHYFSSLWHSVWVNAGSSLMSPFLKSNRVKANFLPRYQFFLATTFLQGCNHAHDHLRFILLKHVLPFLLHHFLFSTPKNMIFKFLGSKPLLHHLQSTVIFL